MSSSVHAYLKRNLRFSALHFTLIDPANQEPADAAKTAWAAERAGSHAVLVGGSTGATARRVDATVRAIQDSVGVPVILFPSGADGVSEAADAILFMAMLNSQDVRFLVGEQLAAVERIEEAGLETIPMGYVVVEPGGRVGQVGQADLVARDDVPTAVRYGLLARNFGMHYVYLEAGSGAPTPVPAPMIRQVRDRSGLPVIVGGGIRDAEAARGVLEAGADIFVTGNLLEGDVDVTKTLRTILSESIKDLRRRMRHAGGGGS